MPNVMCSQCSRVVAGISDSDEARASFPATDHTGSDGKACAGSGQPQPHTNQDPDEQQAPEIVISVDDLAPPPVQHLPEGALWLAAEQVQAHRSSTIEPVRFEAVRAAVALAAFSVPASALEGITAAIESDERMVALSLAQR